MPPRAIPSRVFAASSVSPRRSSSSIAEAGGNFGAPPNPPHSGSASSPRRRVAEKRSDSVSGSDDGAAAAAFSSASSRTLGTMRNLVAALAVEIRDRDEHLAKRRHPVPRLGREVGAADERLALRRKEDGQRPAAVAGHRHHRVHVDPVHVGPLLAVDLDVDEALVHQRRGLRVLERLVRHHVAPVAGRVTDREQDRLVLCARTRERFLAPRVPVDRILGVLKQVRARLVCQAVHPGLG